MILLRPASLIFVSVVAVFPWLAMAHPAEGARPEDSREISRAA